MIVDKFEQFKENISVYWLTDGRDLQVGNDLLMYLRNPRATMLEGEFKWFLADAILNERLSVDEYNKLTDVDCHSRQEVAEDLRELWRQMFGSEPVAPPAKPT